MERMENWLFQNAKDIEYTIFRPPMLIDADLNGTFVLAFFSISKFF
jgi:hypothetical protein